MTRFKFSKVPPEYQWPGKNTRQYGPFRFALLDGYGGFLRYELRESERYRGEGESNSKRDPKPAK